LSKFHALLLFFCFFSLSNAQILFKLGASQLAERKSTSFVLGVISNPYVLVACFVYAFATFCWIWVLREVPLSKAYPLAAMSFIIVPFMSWLILGEKLGGLYIIGVTMIVTGIFLILKNQVF
jgi:drug/metabolite transporter (DMT)-like permease